MKKILNSKIIPYIVILGVVFVLMTPTLIGKIAYQHDAVYHIANVFALDQTIDLTNFDFVPDRILPFIGNDLGYGQGLFYPRLPHTTAVYAYKIFKLVGVEVPYVIELLKFGVLFVAGIMTYHLLISIFKNKNISLIGSVAYITTPYMLSDMYIRNAYAEIYTFIFIPMVFLGLYELFNGSRKKFYLYFTLGYIGMLNSHLVLSVIFTILIIILLLISYKKLFKKENIKALIISSIFILGISAFFWVPMLEHKLMGNYVVFENNSMFSLKSLYSGTVPLSDFITPTREFTAISNTDIVYHVNYFLVLLLIIFIFNYKKILKDTNNKKFIYLMFVFTLVSFIMSTKYFPWKYMPSFIQLIQFPFRMLVFFSFGLSIIGGLSIKAFSEKTQKIILPIIIIGLTFFAYNTITRDNIVHSFYPGDMDSNGMGWEREYLPVKTKENIDTVMHRDHKVHLVSGEGTIKNEKVSKKEISFDIKTNNAKIEFPRLYYLCYEVRIDNKKIKFYENNYGLIQIDLKKGGHVVLKEKDNLIEKTASIISIVSLITGIYLLFIRDKYKKKLQKKAISC